MDTNAGLVQLSVPVGVNEAAQATQNFSVTANLNAAATTGTAVTTPVTIYDSLGDSHALTVTYTKTGSNTWDYAVTLPSGDATGTPVNNTRTLTFDSAAQVPTPVIKLWGLRVP